MSGALALAASIAAMGRAELRVLVTDRRIISPEAVQDPLSLALELLRPDSLNRALQRLDRATLATLGEMSAEDSVAPNSTTREDLYSLGLIGLQQDQPVALREVNDALRIALAAGGTTLEKLQAPGTSETLAAESSEEVDTSGWYAPALTSVRRAAAILFAIREQPAVLGRRGIAAAVSVRDLANTIHSEPEVVGKLLTVLQEAGLLMPITGHSDRNREQQLLVPSSTVAAWMALPLHARWLVLARTAWQGAPVSIRTTLERSGGDLDRVVDVILPLEFPLMPEALHLQARQLAELARELGLTVSGKLSPPIVALEAANDAEAQRAAEQGFPESVPGVYVQPDLSVIIPGPLSPEDEQELSSIAEAEHWGVAVTLRITPASLQKAAKRGQYPDQIRTLLERLSLTGIPQPLDYLLSDVQRNSDQLNVVPTTSSNEGTAPMSSELAPETSDKTTDEAVVVDAAVTDPVVTETDAADASADLASDSDPVTAIIDRVLDAGESEPGSGDLSRRLELAIRDKTSVLVTASARGEEREFLLLPVSLLNGRLRATDTKAGVQRTLPLTAIVAVEPA